MLIQSLIVWLIVALAAWHVGKRLYAMVRGVVQSKPGCATGCGSCEYAPKEEQPVAFVPLSTISIQHRLI